MGKIVTRPNTTAAQVEYLQETLVNYSMGAITADGRGVAKVADDLDTLINQAGSVLAEMCQTMEHVAVDLAFARTEATQLSLKVDELESIVENLLGDVSFDEALDHAATDLIDCFASSGAAEVTADGELAFDGRVTFTKEDIKPYLQMAITRWIEQRLGA